MNFLASILAFFGGNSPNAVPETLPPGAIVVTRQAFDSKEPDDIIYSNWDFISALQENHLTLDEVSKDAARSMLVDYYLGQVNNGGFAQFVYNTGWAEQTVHYVRDGLTAMGATQHLEIFEQGAAVVAALTSEERTAYFEGSFFGDDAIIEKFEQIDDRFFALSDQSDLGKLNANWLRQHPALYAVSQDRFDLEIQKRVDAIPDKAARQAAADEAAPRYVKAIKALCDAAGHELDRITAGDQLHVQDGETAFAWHFLTDQGHHYYVEMNGKLKMYNGSLKTLVVEIDTTDVPASGE